MTTIPTRSAACRVTSIVGDGPTARRGASFCHRRNVTRPVRRWRRPRLERLEDRSVPATITWDGGPTGQGTNWLDPANWVGDVLPGPNDDAVIGAPTGDQQRAIDLSGSTSVHSVDSSRAVRATAGVLTIGAAESRFSPVGADAGGLILDGGSLNVADGTTLINTWIYGPGTLTIPAGVTLGLAQTNTINAPVVNKGTLLVLTAGDFYGSAFTGGLTTLPGSRLWIRGETLYRASSLTVVGGFTNFGTIDFTTTDYQTNAFLTINNGTLTNASGGTITASGGGHGRIEEGLDNQGSISVGPGADLFCGTVFSNSGTISVAGGQLLLNTYGYHSDFLNSGDIFVGAGGFVLAQNLRYLSGSVSGPGGLQLYNSRFDRDFALPVGGCTFQGTVSGSGLVTNPSGSTVKWEASSNGRFLNHGTVLASAGYITSAPTGEFTNGAGATLRIVGTVYCSSDSAVPGYGVGLTNQGFLEIASGATLESHGCRVVNAPGGSITNSGTIYLFGMLTIDQTAGGATFTNAGTIKVLSSCTFTVTGDFGNTGTITGAGAVIGTVKGGTISPAGNSGLPGILSLSGSVVGTGLTVRLNGTTAGTQYDQLKVTGAVTLGGPLVVSLGYTPVLGDVFQIIANDGADPVTGTFTGLPEGAALTLGGRDFRISYARGDGNDVTLTYTPPPVVPRVQSVRVNDGTAQRSSVTSLAVTFNTYVAFAATPADAFILTRNGDAAPVTFTAATNKTGGVTVVTLSEFAGVATENGSLADGRYALTVRASHVSTAAGLLDGNGDGTPGDDYTFGAAQGLRRLYGDATGDGWVDVADLPAFRQTFGRISGDPLSLSYLDGNADGANNGIDLTRFRQAYNFIPRVSAVQVDDGSAQRSRITSLSVTFSNAVTFAGPPAAAFVLTRDDGTSVTFAATVTATGDAARVTLDHFAGAAVDVGSLADGGYTLKVLASQVSTPDGALDGNADGTPGEDFVFGAAQGLFRLYGDGNGDGVVNGADLALFRLTFGRVAGDPLYTGGFDVNGDGAINGIDLTRFRQAFGAGG